MATIDTSKINALIQKHYVKGMTVSELVNKIKGDPSFSIPFGDPFGVVENFVIPAVEQYIGKMKVEEAAVNLIYGQQAKLAAQQEEIRRLQQATQVPFTLSLGPISPAAEAVKLTTEAAKDAAAIAGGAAEAAGEAAGAAAKKAEDLLTAPFKAVETAYTDIKTLVFIILIIAAIFVLKD